jgi:hypothetical protein
MSGKQKRVNISGSMIFMKVDGVAQRVRPGQEITGTIHKDLESDFKLVSVTPTKADEVEVAELKKWLDDNGRSYQPNTGVVKLRKYKADKLAEQAAGGEEATGESGASEEADKDE